MEKVTITCDTCKKELYDNHIKIGSVSKKELVYENQHKPKVGQLISMSRYSDLHFCNKEHFIMYFFDRENEQFKS